MQATVIKPILHKYLINDNFSHDSYIWEQRVWLWLHSPNSDSDLSVNDTYKLPIKFGNCGKCQRSVSLNCGKSFFLELASDSDFFSQKKKKKLVIAILESMTWISHVSKFGKCYYIIN